MSTKLRARMWTRGGLAGLLAAAVLAVVPVAPASAIQTIAWTTAPPASSTVGQPISFAWSGTANTFLGARITGCFANFPEGNNYTRSFGGNFTTGNCNIQNRVIPLSGNYQVVTGFTLSTGGQMTMTWNINVSAPTPTVHITPPASPVAATSAQGYPMPSISAYGSDAVYGTYPAGCTPAAGTALPVGTRTITCSATNAGGKTGSATTEIVVTKGNPVMTWSPPATVAAGTTYGDLMTAVMTPSDATGTISYTKAGGAAVASSDVVPVGDNQGITARYVPSGQAASSYNPVTTTKLVSVLPSAQSVEFAADTPTEKSYGDAPFEVVATGTSGGGNVSIAPQPGGACTVAQTSTGTSVAATVTLTGVGACVLLADQAGNAQHSAAPTAQASVTVAKRTSTITWAPSATQTYGEPLADLLTATADAPGTIDYTVNGDPVTASTVLEAGTDQSVVATFTPTTPGNHTGAVATLVVSVLQAPQALSVAPIADTTYGVAPFELDVSGAGPGTVSAEATGSCTVSGKTVTVITSGDCTITVSKGGTANHLAATPVSRTFFVSKAFPELTWPLPADIVHGTPLSDAQLNAVAPQPGTVSYTVDGGSAPAGGQVLPVGDHTLQATFVPDDSANFLTTTAQVPITVAPQPDSPDTLGPEAQHQVDEQRVETQADLSAGESRTFSVTCPSGYFASDGSGRVDAVDQGTGTLADVLVLESRSSSLDTWTVTMVNHATGRAQGKVFADCVQRETAQVDGHRHALVLGQAATETRNLTGPTTVTVTCADGQDPVAPGFQLDGAGVVRRSEAAGTSAWTFEVVPSGATTGTFSARCLDSRVSRVAGHDHRLDLRQVATRVTVGAGQVVEAQTTCGYLARGIVGGWSLDDGLVLTGAEPRAKTRATRLLNPTSAPLSADLTLQCLETRTVGGSSSTPAAPPVTPQVVVPAAEISLRPQGSVAAPSSRAVTVTARGRVAASVSCASGETTCAGRVQLVALRTQRVAGTVLRRGTVLGSAAFSVAAGSVDRVVLRSTRRGQRVLHVAGLRRAQLRVGDQVRTVSLRR